MKNLFKLFALASIVLAITFTTSSCKKGENDPGISLRSRTSRLSGEWTLASSEYNSSYSRTNITDSNDKYSSSTVTSYDGTTMNSTHSYTDKSWITGKDTTIVSVSSYLYSKKLTINSDGTFNMETVTIDNNTTTTRKTEGGWTWVKANDNLELSNKESFVIAPTKTTSTYSTGESYTSTYEGVDSETIQLIIDRLANDELILITNTQSNSTNSTGDVSTSTETGTSRYTQE